ncbi:MAG: Rpn family recombination-promoting nuclease/putative transposase, partial [Proteobacteria bacterium]|nr:Rpn family recombination-promoting nuclease/putative transposase [Pseudomonadota bacterium]
MGKIDSTSKVFVQKPQVFQDIFKLVFHNAQKPIRDIKPMDPQNLFVQRLPAHGETKRERKHRKQRKALMLAQFSRDIVKTCVCGTDDEADYMVLGIENQAHVDEFMPARVMIYDAMTLHTQMEFLKAQQWPKLKDRFLTGVPKHTKLKPVITVVCYFGTQPWDGPRSLHELFDIKTPQIKALVPDYPIVILDPHTLSDHQLKLLDTSLREVFTCIKASRDRKTLKEIVNSSPRFQHMDPDAVNLIKA